MPGLGHKATQGVPSKLQRARIQIAQRLARRSPYAIAAVKRAVYFGGNRSLSAALDFELAGFVGTGRNPRKHLTADAFQQDYETIGDSPFAGHIEPWLSGTRVEQ